MICGAGWLLADAADGAGAPTIAGAAGPGWLFGAGGVAGTACAARPLSGIGDIGADCQSRPKPTLPSTTIRTAIKAKRAIVPPRATMPL